MANRPLSVLAGLTAGLFLFAASPAAAESGPSPEQAADWQRRLDYAKEREGLAAAMKSEATELFETRKKECFRKFRVNACQHEAKQQYVQTTTEARRIENEAKALERQVKKEKLADKDARYLEEAPQRAADLQVREIETGARRELSAGSEAGKLGHKEEQAREGAARAAANEERLREKRERHERRVAEKMEKARQREAEAAK